MLLGTLVGALLFDRLRGLLGHVLAWRLVAHADSIVGSLDGPAPPRYAPSAVVSGRGARGGADLHRRTRARRLRRAGRTEGERHRTAGPRSRRLLARPTV